EEDGSLGGHSRRVEEGVPAFERTQALLGGDAGRVRVARVREAAGLAAFVVRPDRRAVGLHSATVASRFDGARDDAGEARVAARAAPGRGARRRRGGSREAAGGGQAPRTGAGRTAVRSGYVRRARPLRPSP